MRKEYKTVRIAYETKYWLNELIAHKEEELKKVRDSLIVEYEVYLKQQPAFLDGYSPTLSISVTHGSIVEAAYNYTKDTPINWNQKRSEMEIAIKKDIDGKNLDVGTLTPKLYLYTDVLEGLEKYRSELKPENMQRNLMLNYIIKLIVFVYHQKIFPEKYVTKDIQKEV